MFQFDYSNHEIVKTNIRKLCVCALVSLFLQPTNTSYCRERNSKIVLLNSIMNSYKCYNKALTNMSTRISPLVSLHLLTTLPHMYKLKRMVYCILHMHTHAICPIDMHISPSYTPSSASAQHLHVFYTECKLKPTSPSKLM